VLTRQFAERRAKFVEQGLRPAIAALRSGRRDDATRIVVDLVHPLYEPVGKSIAGLMAFYVEAAPRDYAAAVARHDPAAMQALHVAVQHNVERAHQVNALARSASDTAVRGGAAVAQVVDTMKGMNESAREIADIINLIDSIAFQTNILALNAAVEAARAGPDGPDDGEKCRAGRGNGRRRQQPERAGTGTGGDGGDLHAAGRRSRPARAPKKRPAGGPP
jgi:hypothetical protein